MMNYTHIARPLTIVTTLFASAAALAATGGSAQGGGSQSTAEEELQEVTVTGSRVITNGNDSPTPVTVVSKDQLTVTTPTNLADGLNHLPVFGGSTGQQSARQSTLDNTAGNFLNLRGLGSVRNLILFDGHRVPPTSSVGTVDVDSLPQMLVQRVDVVTGGASAVYGSDAISGVINFVLDRKFNGLKIDASGGLSGKHDDRNRKFGIAAGTSFGEGRGHIEGSFEHFSSDGIPNMFAREAGRKVYTIAGAGTAASPFHTVENGRLFWASWGGLAIPLVPGPLAGDTFVDNNGTLAPADPIKDLSYVQDATMLASLKTDQAYARIDYDLTDQVHVYSQANYAVSANQYQLTPMLYVFKWILPDNAFLPPAARTALAGPGGGPFLFGKDSRTNPGFNGDAHGHTVYGNLGISGKLFGSVDYDLSYTHGESRQLTSTLNNLNNLKLAAALDAVVDPATGNIVCSSTVSNPGQFPGCVPLDPFGPSSETPAMLQYIEASTSSHLTNRVDDFFGNIVGAPFSTWAGAVRTSLSAELRHQSLRNDGVDNTVSASDCVGLRLSVLTCPQTRYTSPAAGDAYGSESIRELAVETNIPLVKDVFLVRSLDVNGAYRNAHYSTSGNANTWKAGLVWRITDEFTVRGARSRDFRAPTLLDLFGPVSNQPSGYTDLHTGVNGITIIQSGGNPNLKPEVGETTTVGIVYRPQWANDFSVALDYYDIKISDAIAQFSGADPAIQQQCEASNGTSPSCSLYVRPLPFNDRTAANFPSLVYVQGLNLSSQKVNGVDGDINYGMHLGSGRLDLRGLVTYQPKNDTQLFPGAPVVHGAGTAPGVSSSSAASFASGGAGLPKWKMTAFGAYHHGPYELDVQTRWRSSLKQTNNTAVSSDRDVPAVSFTDVTLAYTAEISRGEVNVFLNVQNVFDKAAPIWQQSGSANAPGYFYPAVNGDDIVGRYFTLGLRARF